MSALNAFTPHLALNFVIQISFLLCVVLNGKLGPLRGVSLVAGNILVIFL